MRARGAGGQVYENLSAHARMTHAIVACEQNGIRGAPDAHADWDYCFDARRTKPTSGTSRLR